MEKIACSCTKCKVYLGEFINQWIKIGKSYVSPVVEPEEISPIGPTGTARLGEKQTLIENCHLQDQACRCGAVIGLRCLDTPVNHVLHNGQLFLQLSSVVFTGLDWNAKHVQIRIQRTLKLRKASRSGFTAANSPQASEDSSNMSMNNDGPSEIHGHLLDHLQAQLDAQREETQRLNRAGFHMASSFDSAVLRIESEMKKFKESMVDLQEDQIKKLSRTGNVEDDVTLLKVEVDDLKKVSQNASAYTRLEREVSLAKQAIADVGLSLSNELDKSAKKQQRKHEILSAGLGSVQLDLGVLREELDGTKKTATERISVENNYAKEVASLRAELKELREELAKERSQKSLPRDPVIPSREIDILTTNITKIGQRASQVEALQMGFELLRERVQRMEKMLTPNTQDALDIESQTIHSTDSVSGTSGQKRKHNPRPEETANLRTSPTTSPSKRPTRKSWSSSPSTPPSSRTQTLGAQPFDSPRLTKSGAVDKRSTRRITRLAALRSAASND
ncbi:hypothetical protein F4781DRAFT_168284 [Annulohypoxylon bovei var. microspora]|nr:hypothetical protein F4781DRAFT_168284 [Annulohypoxylon bovei var. microspora]